MTLRGGSARVRAPAQWAPTGPELMAVLIKRYANRKLYNTKTSRYITLKGIADLLESGEDVRVIDNETGEDITSITLSQILVDTERSNRNVPGGLLTGLFQKGGDALYDAFSKGVDDASERLDEMQRNMRSILRGQERGEGGKTGARPDWIAFSPPDLDKLVQGTLERVFKVLDLPRRSDVQALTERLDRLIVALDEADGKPGVRTAAKADTEVSADSEKTAQ
jgi:polyhydroxyalkanoate synthesis repressor PhaR